MLNLLRSLVLAAFAFFRTRRQLAAEILALRHQLGVLKRSVNSTEKLYPKGSASRRSAVIAAPPMWRHRGAP